MEPIDESETQTNIEEMVLNNAVTTIDNNDNNYSEDSMYSSDENDIHIHKYNSNNRMVPASPSVSYNHLDRVQQYMEFGPRIQLSTDNGTKDCIRYSAVMNAQRLSSKLGIYNHARGGGVKDSIGQNFILNGNDKGYGSDGSDDSVSMVSQSYEQYIFDANYKSKMHPQSMKGPKLQLQFSNHKIYS